jgi:hypothetical protein
MCHDCLFSPKCNLKRQVDIRKEWTDMKINGTHNEKGTSDCRLHVTYVSHE